MLLTVFLIGLVTSIAVINVGQDGNDIAKLEAKRFAALVTHLQDESTLIGFPMGVEVSESENRYRFWLLEDKWALIDRQEVLREREVPGRVEMSVELLHSTEEKSESDIANDDPENDSEQVESKKPDAPPRNLLMVEPTGLIRPFIASFRGDSQIFRVSLDVFLNPVVSSESI
jgi:hypothetical protein